jgi:hypothetical protein
MVGPGSRNENADVGHGASVNRSYHCSTTKGIMKQDGVYAINIRTSERCSKKQCFSEVLDLAIEV